MRRRYLALGLLAGAGLLAANGAGCSSGTFQSAADAGPDTAMADTVAPPPPDAPAPDAPPPPAEAGACAGVNLMTSSANCGACGHDCLGRACTNGICAADTLVGGLSNPREFVIVGSSAFVTVQGTCNCLMGTVIKVPLGPDGGATTTVAMGQDQPDSIAGDTSDVYWANYRPNGAAIEHVNVATGAVDTFCTALQAPLALTLAGGRLYWASSVGQLLWQARGTQNASQQLLDHSPNRPSALVLDAAGQGPLVWAEAYDQQMPTAMPTGSISSVPTSGAPIAALSMNEAEPTSIVQAGTELFWAALAGGAIRDLPAGATQAIDLANGLPNPVRVAADDTNVYWTELGSQSDGSAGDGQLVREARAGSVPLTLANQLAAPAPLALDAQYVYWLERGAGSTAGSLKRVPK